MTDAELVAYVSAIHQLSSPMQIVRQEATHTYWLDQGFTVNKTETTYWFANGAVIRQTIEQDDFPTEQACMECWIDYQVLSPSDAAPIITPQHQGFSNACREQFWLKYHRA